MKKIIKMRCALCGQPIEVDPAQIPEDGTDLNFFCVLCGVRVANLMEDHNLPGRIELHYPQR